MLSRTLCPICLNLVLLFPVVSPPSECPMHKAEAGPAHQDRAYEFVQCPMKGASSDIDPANMVHTLLYCWTVGGGWMGKAVRVHMCIMQ